MVSAEAEEEIAVNVVAVQVLVRRHMFRGWGFAGSAVIDDKWLGTRGTSTKCSVGTKPRYDFWLRL